MFLVSCGDVVKPDDAALVQPAVTSVEPDRGIVSTKVTLAGSDFGAAQAESTITIGGVMATVETWSDTSIVAAIPDVLPGDAEVVVSTAAGASAPDSVRVILPPRAYIENNANAADGFNTLTVMGFEAATGALAELGVISTGVPAPSFGGCVTSLVLHEPTRRLFASGTVGVAVFAIDPVTGMLAPIPGSPFPSPSGMGIDVNAAGTRLWQAGAADNVSVFNIAETGALVPVPGSPFAATPSPDVLVASRDGNFVYANTEGNVLHAFSVTASGALTPLPGSPYATPGFSYSIAQRPGRDQIYIGQGQTLEVWQPAPGTGVPAQITGSPFAVTVPAGNPQHIAFTPDGSRAYIGADNGGYIAGVNLDAGGAVTVMAGSPWNVTATLADISCMAMSRDGSHLVALAEGKKLVGVFKFGANGTPSQVTNSPFSITSLENMSGLAITF